MNLNTEINQYQKHFLKFLDYQDFEAMIKRNDFTIDCSFAIVSFLSEIKPVVREKYEVEYRLESLTIALIVFGLSGFRCRELNRQLLIGMDCLKLKFSDRYLGGRNQASSCGEVNRLKIEFFP